MKIFVTCNVQLLLFRCFLRVIHPSFWLSSFHFFYHCSCLYFFLSSWSQSSSSSFFFFFPFYSFSSQSSGKIIKTWQWRITKSVTANTSLGPRHTPSLGADDALRRRVFISGPRSSSSPLQPDTPALAGSGFIRQQVTVVPKVFCVLPVAWIRLWVARSVISIFYLFSNVTGWYIFFIPPVTVVDNSKLSYVLYYAHLTAKCQPTS